MVIGALWSYWYKIAAAASDYPIAMVFLLVVQRFVVRMSKDASMKIKIHSEKGAGE